MVDFAPKTGSRYDGSAESVKWLADHSSAEFVDRLLRRDAPCEREHHNPG
jgi:hypothetical protein